MDEYSKKDYVTRIKRRNLASKYSKLRPKKVTPKVKYSRKSKHPKAIL